MQQTLPVASDTQAHDHVELRDMHHPERGSAQPVLSLRVIAVGGAAALALLTANSAIDRMRADNDPFNYVTCDTGRHVEPVVMKLRKASDRLVLRVALPEYDEKGGLVKQDAQSAESAQLIAMEAAERDGGLDPTDIRVFIADERVDQSDVVNYTRIFDGVAPEILDASLGNDPALTVPIDENATLALQLGLPEGSEADDSVRFVELTATCVAVNAE